MTATKWDAIVVGSGFAGLAAATRLSERGKKVLVLEKRPILGGRASSFKDTPSGETLDNGQHLFLGCYAETRKYLARIGADHLLQFQPAFAAHMTGSSGEGATLKGYPLPAPWNFAAGIALYGALRFRDRFRMFRVAAAARKGKGVERCSVRDWLGRLGQSEEAIRRLWEPLTLATLNIRSEEAPADLLAVVLRKGFLSNRAASSVGLSTVGLSDLHAEPAKVWIEKRGGEVRSRTAVRSLRMKNSKVEGVELLSGGIESAPRVILAVPPDALRNLIPLDAPPRLKKEVRKTEVLRPSPIVSFHVWVEGQVPDAPLVGFWDGPFHWVFRKSGKGEAGGATRLSWVISGANDALQLTKEDLSREALRQLKWICPDAGNIRRAVVSRETEATWIPPLSGPSPRLGTRTPVKGLILAGDWTDTGLPATIEGATLSGHRAAEEGLP